jgi:hypothetical protein
MIGDAEAVGGAVTGALAARALEPQAGEGGLSAEGACLNCNTPLAGKFCHACGQPGHVHRTLTAFWHDLAHSVLHFDGKIWRTLPMLAWWPGELTRRYVDGERARFVSPMALFLFSVFLMFAVFSFVGGPINLGDIGEQTRAEAAADVKIEREEVQGHLEGLRKERARAVASGAPTRAIDLSIANVEANVAVLDATTRLIESGTEEEFRQAMAADGAIIGKDGKIDVETGVPALNEAIQKAGENPKLLAYKIQTNAYKFSWALIPISVPFVWMLFLHRRRYRRFRAYDHTVFVTYSICFMSLGLVALSLLRPLGLSEGIIGLATSFVPPIHMYRQLRGAYVLSRWSALWRTVALIVFSGMAIGLFMMLLVALGAFS